MSTIINALTDSSRLTPMWRRILLATVIFFTFFVNNDVFVPDIMESRNLVTAREMVQEGNWLVPTMNGELRFEKPPLPTWVAAGIEIVSADNIMLQRSMAALMGVLLVLFFYKFASRICRIDPLWPTLILCTCYNMALMARTVSWDIYTHAFMMGSIYYLAAALTRPGWQWRSFIASGVLTGLSILSKGPVSLFALFLPYLIAFGVCYRPRMKGKWSGVAMMSLIAIVVGCWWYLFIYIFHSDELNAMAARETGAWMNRNVRPWWYYHKFYLEAGIWVPLLLTAIVTMAVRSWRTRSIRTFMPQAWMWSALILLSTLPEKKTRYLLPVLIPASLLCGQLICYWIRSLRESRPLMRTDVCAYRINAWMLCTVTALLPAAAYIFLVQPGYMPLWGWIILLICSLLIAFCLGISAVRRAPGLTVWSVAALFIVAAMSLPAVRPLINYTERTSISGAVNKPSLSTLPLYSNSADELRIEMVYAAGRRIRPIDLTDSATLHAALPMALLTHTGAKEIPQHLLKDIDTVYVGHYDDNRRPPMSGRHSPLFLYHITILKKK